MTAKIIYSRLIAVLFIGFVFLTSALFFLVALTIWLTTSLFDRRLWLLHQFTCFWASLYVWIFPPWSVTINGRERIKDNQTYVIVSNHQSLVDILVAFNLFYHFKWVSKAELFQIPLIGWNMSLNRYVRLKRGHSRSVKEMYQACEQHLKQGSSIYVFPEGTRSATGHMREFKEGAFVLAKRLEIPILPLVINGSRDALPKNSLDFQKTEVVVQVLDAIAPESFRETTVEDLTNQVREKIKANLILPD